MQSRLENSTQGSSWRSSACLVAVKNVGLPSLLSFICLTGCGPASPTKQTKSIEPPVQPVCTNPPLPAGYAVIATVIAGTSVLERYESAPSYDDTALQSSMQTGMIELRQLDGLPPDLASIRDDALAAVTDLLDAKNNLGELPKPPGFADQLAKAFVLGLIFDFDRVVTLAESVERQSEALQNEVRRMARSINRFRASGLMLPAIAKKYCGPPYEGRSAVQIDFDEAWPVPGVDWLTITNNTGFPLHNCTIATKLSGRAGATAVNVHFFKIWLPGQSFHCPYMPEVTFLDMKMGRETVPGVQTVIVDLFADEVAQEQLQYKYAGAERDRDVVQYCRGLGFHSRYRPFAKGTFLNDRAAVFCRFSGQHTLPKGRLTVDLSNGAYKTSATIDFASWKPDQELKVEFPNDQWEPTSSTAKLHFDGSTAEFNLPIPLGR